MSKPQRRQEQNRMALARALDELRLRIEARHGNTDLSAVSGQDDVAESGLHSMPFPIRDSASESALDRIVRKFHLTAFERDLLLLTAGVELDARIARLAAELAGDPQRGRPTFSLALSILDEPHWSAISPDGVLRRARLIRLEQAAGLVDAVLHIEENVLHTLSGAGSLDERLRPFVSVCRSHSLAFVHAEAAERIVDGWQRPAESGERPQILPKILLMTGDAPAGVAMAAAAADALNFKPLTLDLQALPADRSRIEEILDLWQRDAVLHDLALIIEAGTEPADRRGLLQWVLDRLTGLVVVVGERTWSGSRSNWIVVDAPEPSPQEQLQLWKAAAGSMAGGLNGHLGRIAEQFRLPAHVIMETAEALRSDPEADSERLGERAWELCRLRSRGGMDDLAQRIRVRASWDTLVLPAPQIELLQSIALQMRHRYQVYENWGFRDRVGRGLGLSALFHGPSGVGKTYAAEVLAGDLKLDLYRVDLSSTVSKYIGETEKNLKRIFDSAEQSGAILLFDEADALFGKRSEVRDSHDRYANLEISYLLQRIEAYRGLAILTTNLKNALDGAFLRRFRFVVQFPFPSAAERERIWRKVFPSDTPLDAGIDWVKLGRLAVSGGNIANIAMDAAFRAAQDETPVSMPHLLAAARAECLKIEKPLSDNEVRGWV